MTIFILLILPLLPLLLLPLLPLLLLPLLLLLYCYSCCLLLVRRIATHKGFGAKTLLTGGSVYFNAYRLAGVCNSRSDFVFILVFRGTTPIPEDDFCWDFLYRSDFNQ